VTKLLIATRWWLHLARHPLRDHLVPRWMAWMLVLVQLDAMVDMPATSRLLLAQPWWVAGLAVGALVALQAASERRGVDEVVRHGRFGVVRRQPLGPWEVGAPVFLVGLALCAPLGLLGWLWSRSVGVGVLWAVSAVAPVVWAGSGRPARAALGVIAAGGLGALAQLGGWLAWPLVGLAAVATLPLVGDAALRWPLPPGAAPGGLPWRVRTALGALVQRDLLVLWRTERSLVWWAVSVAPVVGGMVWAARVNGDFGASALVTGAVLALAFVAPLSLAVLAAVARGLGRQLDPPSLPVRAVTRLGGLGVVGSAAVVPSWAAAGVGAHPALGWPHHVQLGAYVAALGLVAASLLALRPRRPDHGVFPYAIAATLLGTLFAGGPLRGALVALGVGGLAWAWGASRLARRREAR